MSEDHGRFPFGRPNTIRPARKASKPKAVVVGVYPSAWHVQWRPPRNGKGVAALAVDVEPTVFWDGDTDDFASRLSRWCDSVGFRQGDEPGQHGHISSRSPSTNGSSGRKVIDHYLGPLGLDPGSVTFTDVYPVFVLKYGRGSSKRQQGDAIRDEYDPASPGMGMNRSTLPRRPSPSTLPKLAARDFATRVVTDIAEAAADLVITLGPEVWNTFLRIPDLAARPPAKNFEALYGPLYGQPGELSVLGKKVTWLPLVHPGLLGAVVDSADTELPRRTVPGWNSLHARWKARRR